ncbi:1-acyl-sn-glycerol-3-phosphate acyltransferase [Cellulomonas sp. URHD0024]|uniref:lysophospholipid acyltransferase family protein n=1 Tax=Cellulomonas sp. URHD0024 TaxID=1302620 RepID=UPI00041D6961|nr:lysophospholipid acyltransferase family protein [Cellulomonas sp. URHD0024]
MHPPARSNRAYRTVAHLVRPLLRAMTRKDWHGVEHMPTERGFIAASNHMTNIDPLTFAYFLWESGFAPKILAKASLFKVPVMGKVLHATGQIPVYRNTVSAAESLTAAIDAINDGDCVAVFPEGTLTRDPDLWPMVGKTGVARLALTTRAPVVPVAQWGPQLLLGRYQKMLRPIPRKTITIVAGPPVDLSDLYDNPQDTATLREATERVMAAIGALLTEIRGEQPPEVRYDMRKPVDPGENSVAGDHATKPEQP